ncbi:MAG: hypothetical protein ACW98I_20680 [Candidatus Hodarchaeales archaeon]|jgi:hypothetical protein
MENKLRIRETKLNAELVLLKLLPLIFMILMFMMASSVVSGPEGGMGSGID